MLRVDSKQAGHCLSSITNEDFLGEQSIDRHEMATHSNAKDLHGVFHVPFIGI